MSGVLHYILLTCLSIEFILGNVGNAFTVLVNIMDWIKRRKISFIDKIFTALAISRIGFLWTLITILFVRVLHPDLIITRRLVRNINISWTVTNHFSIWLATCLSIFYFLKIGIFSNSTFHIRWKVERVVSMTLLASLLIIFLNILVINKCVDVWIDIHQANISYSAILDNSNTIAKLILLINTMFTLIPFTVSLATFLLFIISLWRHLKNMQRSAKGSRDVSTTAHIKALQMVVTFLLLYTLFFLSLLLQFCEAEFKKRDPVNLLFWVTEVSFPSCHSYVLILGNTKLRHAFLSIAWWLRRRINDAEPSDS